MTDNNLENGLSFKVSTGLKNLIGKDLISDEFIAMFELVKNSYDAGAENVILSFIKSDNGDSKIIISDNGCGMNYDDIVNKWLFVAYSEKKPENKKTGTYIDNIKRVAAGAKGVGRFSCDRLGTKLTLITKTATDNIAHVINVNWEKFEENDKRQFMEVNVDYSTLDALPSNFNSGTELIISGLCDVWDRKALLKLKQSLMRLVSPDADIGDIPFRIEINAPDELREDKRILEMENYLEREIVNGLIVNDIFEKLDLKTTNIDVLISKDGKMITTTLSDRGEYVFTIKENNAEYSLLEDIHISIFYLNRTAKINFTKLMGVVPKNYGSVFIYKNGFRVNPYGDPEKDFFGIDQRKAQGYKRFLGTREILGRISIKGDNKGFIETTSRAHGFINTPEVNQLSDFFVDKVLKVLEKYVVNIISWGEPLKGDSDHIIYPSEVSNQIISQFLNMETKKQIISIDYNQDLLVKKSKEDGINTSLKKLQAAAEETNNKEIRTLSKDIDKKTTELKSQNLALEKENVAKSQELNKAIQEKSAKEIQVRFLQGATNQTVENLLDGMHSIFTQTEAIQGNIKRVCNIIEQSDIQDKIKILKILELIAHSNRKSNKYAELAIKGNQTLKPTGSSSLKDFILQCIENGSTLRGLQYIVNAEDKAYNCMFEPVAFGIILDNISSNSLKARADKLEITLSENATHVVISFADNGVGLNPNIDPKLFFDWGVSTTSNRNGFGMGLHQIKRLVELDMNGSIEIDPSYNSGFRLVVSIPK